ncbi:alpha/beta hydrolase [Mycobacterium nebraskense]|uniref:alpha/beta hydrolase n=1 Tax=Mycobacterium nebraskense TaxID=244292 RepID=UPI002F408933
MLLALLRLSKATRVDAAAVTAPVLVIGGESDLIVPAGVLRQTAAQYRHADVVHIPKSDHMVFSGASLATTMGHIDEWLKRISSKVALARAVDPAPRHPGPTGTDPAHRPGPRRSTSPWRRWHGGCTRAGRSAS